MPHTYPTSRCCLFFFNDTATTEIYTLSLHDALPIFRLPARSLSALSRPAIRATFRTPAPGSGGCARKVARIAGRSEEHTSELQSQSNLVCRLLLEKKKTHNTYSNTHETSRASSG